MLTLFQMVQQHKYVSYQIYGLPTLCIINCQSIFARNNRPQVALVQDFTCNNLIHSNSVWVIFLYGIFSYCSEYQRSYCLSNHYYRKPFSPREGRQRWDRAQKKEIITKIALSLYMLYPAPKGLYLKVKS